jgi:predicted thioesterase
MRLTDGLRAAQAECNILVTSEMTASLNGKEIHPVYSTFWLAYHAECASRLAIEPFFEEGENAIGAELHLRHEAMSSVGTIVRVVAQVEEISEREGRVHCIVCAIEAFCMTHSGEQRVASGSQTQIILPQTLINERIQAAYR